MTQVAALLQTRAQPKFSVGDRVRITKKKKTFEKGYTSRWTEEVFTVSQVKHTTPITYNITDYSGEEIQGTFYEHELQKNNQEVYRIEKVIKKGKTKSLVKWKGYTEAFNSWVNNTELTVGEVRRCYRTLHPLTLTTAVLEDRCQRVFLTALINDKSLPAAHDCVSLLSHRHVPLAETLQGCPAQTNVTNISYRDQTNSA